MKQIMTISAALLFLTIGKVQAQNGIEQVLKNIETNNKELQANEQLITSQKLEAKTDNNLPDPTLSYAHLWGAKDKSETIGELVVSQSFDFPSLYATRNAEELAKMYAKRLQTGDANALETNKINLELLNVRTEASLNETALRNKQQELNTLNGNIPVVFEENQYPAIPFPTDYQILKSEVMATDRTLMALGNESLVARKQIAVNKSQWLPKLELGYRRNTETGVPFNGVVVGFSFPLFENRNKVKIAKAQALNIDLQKDNATLQVESELAQLYREAKTLHASMEEYSKTFQSQQDLSLLKQALTGGQISMIEYFVEVSVIYQSHQNYLQLENQYQKAMARIYKSKL